MASNICSNLSVFETELVNRVHAHFPKNDPRKFLFFYTNASPYSNFYPSVLTENGIQFHWVEQYMMYNKAKLFKDDEIAEEILKAKKPAQCKALGRKVKGFKPEIWSDNRTRIVMEGNYLKFTQNEDLKQLLLSHNDTLFVEAAPNDRIWGVGLRDTDPLINERSTWKGLNLMGYLLTDIAYRIRSENENKTS